MSFGEWLQDFLEQIGPLRRDEHVSYRFSALYSVPKSWKARSQDHPRSFLGPHHPGWAAPAGGLSSHSLRCGPQQGGLHLHRQLWALALHRPGDTALGLAPFSGAPNGGQGSGSGVGWWCVVAWQLGIQSPKKTPKDGW